MQSNRCCAASCIIRSNAGRLDFAPENPVSMYSAEIIHPRRTAYSRSSRTCISQFWSVVDTLAYSTHRTAAGTSLALLFMVISSYKWFEGTSPAPRQRSLCGTTPTWLLWLIYRGPGRYRTNGVDLPSNPVTDQNGMDAEV